MQGTANKIEIWKQLYGVLKHDPQLLSFVGLIDHAEPVYLSKTPEEFAACDVHEMLAEQMAKINPARIEELIGKLDPLPSISAKIIKATKTYTLALLIIPPGQVFGWHDHRKMNGLSRCMAGSLSIRALDPSKMVEVPGKNSYYTYGGDNIRKEVLDTKNNPISIIYPDSFNIHEIKAGQTQSAFIDLLIPEYPEGDCQYFCTVEDISEERQQLMIKKVTACQQKIESMDDSIRALAHKK